ncbi:MAG: L-threonylcarbamoyladenylate synthase [Chitinophagaceae bacterium]
MNHPFEQDIIQALKALKKGGTILYPTDTVWGIGCDATNEEAIRKIITIKQRDAKQGMIILVAEEKQILQFVAAPGLAVFDYIKQQANPTTIIFDDAIGLPASLIYEDGSIGIRIVQDEFCRHLIKRFGKPLVSTSANISGHSPPQNFSEISSEIKDSVDYIIQWRRDDQTPSQPSKILKWRNDGSITVIRP